jgi:plastocyanin
MKYVLGFIVGFVILSVVIYAFVTHLPGVNTAPPPKISPSPTPQKLTINETLVTYMKDGFSPSTVTIPVNTSVKFTNTSTISVSVNSDDYPTNQLYPQLNLGIMEKNESKIVRLTKTGIYTYHNQLNPKQTGKIIVQ